jgi:hypothetical protein
MEHGVKLQAWLKWSGRCVYLAILFIPLMVRADSVGKQIVDEAIDVSDADTMRLEIRFIMPVTYLWYFPHSQKDDFLIAIRPITGLADYNTSIREHIRIPDTLSTVIKDLYYDGTEETERFIVLETNQKVGISIKQDHDMKSIVVEFTSIAPKPAGECGRQPKKGKADSIKE